MICGLDKFKDNSANSEGLCCIVVLLGPWHSRSQVLGPDLGSS